MLSFEKMDLFKYNYCFKRLANISKWIPNLWTDSWTEATLGWKNITSCEKKILSFHRMIPIQKYKRQTNLFFKANLNFHLMILNKTTGQKPDKFRLNILSSLKPHGTVRTHSITAHIIKYATGNKLHHFQSPHALWNFYFSFNMSLFFILSFSQSHEVPAHFHTAKSNQENQQLSHLASLIGETGWISKVPDGLVLVRKGGLFSKKSLRNEGLTLLNCRKEDRATDRWNKFGPGLGKKEK